MRRSLMVMAVLIGASSPYSVPAQEPGEHARHAVPAAAASPVALVDGEVRRVDKKAGKIMLKHGPIANLEMPPMSMVFRAKDPSILDQVKVGDRVRFAAEKIGDEYTVTRIERVE